MEDPLVVILFVVFSVGSLSICAHRVNSQINQSRASLAAIHRYPQQPSPESLGIDPESINAFPIIKYSDVKDIQIGKGIMECAICLTEFSDEDLVRLLPECDHVFHPLCIDQWLPSHATCPVCRTNLIQLPEPDNAEAAHDDRGLSNDVAIDIDDGITAAAPIRKSEPIGPQNSMDSGPSRS